jgi:hypothetical protein
MTTTPPAEPSALRPPDLLTRRLLTCGAVAAPLFVAAFLVEGATRRGYSPLRDAVSALAIGQDGWTQVANFITCGILMAAFAAGLRRALRPGVTAVGAPILAGLFAAGLIAAGVFITDPEDGYPPGTAGGPAQVRTWHGNAHNVVSAVVFLTLPALCFVVAVWFAQRARRPLWASYSAVTGVAMLALTQGLSVDGYGGLYQRLTIAAGWGWLTLLALHLRRRPNTQPA